MIPVELITMGVSALLGSATKLMAQSQAARREEHKMILARQQAYESSLASARKMDDGFAKATRRIIVLCLMGFIGWILLAPLFGMQPVVPVEVETGFRALFGLIDTTHTTIEYQSYNGVVTPDWIRHAVLSIIAYYFGVGAAKA